MLARALPAIIAQAPGGVMRTLIVIGLLIVLVVIGGLIAAWLRRRYLEPDQPPAPGALSLQDLRSLHAQGRLSDEEYESLRAAALREHADPGTTHGTPTPPASPVRDGALRARPGFDLSGEPLPNPAPDPENPDGPSDIPPESTRNDT